MFQSMAGLVTDNKPYDGRELTHTKLGKPIKLWDFAHQTHDLIKEDGRWLCEFLDEQCCLYFHADDSWSVIHEMEWWMKGDWGTYMMASNPTHKFADTTTTTTECTCPSFYFLSAGCPKMSGGNKCFEEK